MATFNGMTRAEVFDVLFQSSQTRLAEMWCEFNHWNFPVEFKKLEPENWHNLTPSQALDITSELMDLIKSFIADKIISKEWNKDRMTDNEFEELWRKGFFNVLITRRKINDNA